MRKILIVEVVLFLLSGCFQVSPEPHNVRYSPPTEVLTPTPFSGVTKPIIKIRCYEMVSQHSSMFSVGTGFVIMRNKHTYMITAYHVVKSSLLLEFSTHDDKRLTMEFARMTVIPHLDVAIF